MSRAQPRQAVKGNKLIRLLSAFEILCASLVLSACSDAADTNALADTGQILIQGQQYLDQSQFKASMRSAEQVMVQNPEHEDGYLLMAKVLLKLGQTNAAIETLDKYQGTPSADFIFTKIEAYQKDKKLISSQKLLDTHTDLLAKQGPRLTLTRAIQFLLNARYDSAKTEYEHLLNNPDYQVEGLIGLARVAALEKRPQDGLDYLEKAHALEPDNIDAMMLQSAIHIGQGKLNDAEHYLTMALTALPAADLFTPERIQLLETLIDTLTRQGRSAEASIYSRLLSEEFPEASSINQRYIEALNLYKKQDYEQAEQKLLSLINDAPMNKQASTLLGVLLYRKGDYQGANQYLANIVDPESSDDNLTQMYALTQLKTAQSSQVISMLNPVINEEENPEILYLYTVAAISQRDWEKARTGLERMEKFPPKSSYLALARSEFYTRSPQPELDKAESELTNALNKEPGNLAVEKALMQNYIRQNKIKEADEFAGRLAASKLPVSRLLAANFYIYNNKSDNARVILNDLLKTNPNDANAQLGLAKLDLTQQNWEGALKTYQDFVTNHPNDARGYQGVAICMVKLGKNLQLASTELPQNHNPAILALIQAGVSLKGNDLKMAGNYLAKMPDTLPVNLKPYKELLDQELTYRRTLSALQYKDYAAAREAALSNIQKAPDNQRYLAVLISVELQSKQFGEAKKLIGQMKTQFPDSTLSDYFSAELALGEGNPKEAASILRALWDKSPNNELAQKLYQALRSSDGKSGTLFLNEWLEAFPSSLSAKVSKALELEAENELKKAISLYEEILVQAPSHVASLNNAAWLYHLEKDQRALPLAKKAYELAPGNPYVLDTYGWILYQAGQVSQARSLLEKAKIMLPDNQDVQEHWKQVSQ